MLLFTSTKLRFRINFVNELLKVQSSIQKRQFQTSPITESLILSKYQSKRSIQKSYIKKSYLNQYRCLLETTKTKIIGCFDDALDYVEKLIKEKYDLEKKLSENESNELENMQEKIKRLNYLNEVFILFEKLSKFIKDIKELNEMAKEIDKKDENMKSLIQEDFAELNNKILQYKIELIDLIGTIFFISLDNH